MSRYCSPCGNPDCSDVEEYVPESIEQTYKKEYLDSKMMSQLGSIRNRKLEKEEAILRKSSAIAKTIQDPSGQLSKRRRKKLNALKHDEMNNNVVYSMNKQKRWEVDPDELLLANQNLGIEVIVVEKVEKSSRPGLCYFVDNDNVKSVRIYDCNPVTARSSHSENPTRSVGRTADRRKDDVEVVPYIEYRIVRPTRNTKVLLEVTQQECNTATKKVNGRRHKKIEPEVDSDEGDFSDYEDDYSEEQNEQEKGFKLADYMAAQKYDFFKKSQSRQRRGSNNGF